MTGAEELAKLVSQRVTALIGSNKSDEFASYIVLSLKKLVKDIAAFIGQQISTWVEDTQMDEPEDSRSVRLQSLSEINESWSAVAWLSDAVAQADISSSSLYDSSPLFD